MRRARLKLLPLVVVTIIALVITACNFPGSDGEAGETQPTDDQGTIVTQEQDGDQDRDQDQDQRPTTDIEPTEDSDDGGGGPPTPDLSDVDPLGGYSPITPLSPSTTPLTLTYIWMEDNSNGWAIGDTDGTSEHVFHTDSGAESWEDVTPPAPGVIPELGHPAAAAGAFMDEDTAWVIYYPDVSIFEAGGTANAFVWRTTNGGGTWTPSVPFRTDMIGSTNIPPDIVFSDSSHGWIMMHWGGQGMHRSPVYLYRTTDGGATWEKLVDPFESVFLQSCSKTGMAFYGGNYGMVTIADCPIDGIEVSWTNDGGVTWEDIRLPAPASDPDLFSGAHCNAFSPAFLDDGTAIVGAVCKIYDEDRSVYLIYRSTDHGASWTGEEYPSGNLFVLDEDTIWGLREQRYDMSGDIYRTTDGGANWMKLNTVIWYGQFCFVDEDFGWAIAHNEDEIATVATDNGGATWNIVESFVTD